MWSERELLSYFLRTDENKTSTSFVSLCRPFFDKITIDLPAAKRPLVITAPGAPQDPYVNSVTVNGRQLDAPIITHADIASGGHIDFRMSSTPQSWGSSTLVRHATDSSLVTCLPRHDTDLRTVPSGPECDEVRPPSPVPQLTY